MEDHQNTHMKLKLVSWNTIVEMSMVAKTAKVVEFGRISS